jgi:hemerythrin
LETKINSQTIFQTGIENIDEQHGQLYYLIGRLEKSLGEAKESSLLEDAVGALTLYASVHFQTEDELMVEISYSERKTHNDKHQIFISQIEAFKAALKRRDLDLNRDILKFLKDWIDNHVSVDDAHWATAFHTFHSSK